MVARSGFTAFMGRRAAVILLVALCAPHVANAWLFSGCTGGPRDNTCGVGYYCDTDGLDSCEVMANCWPGYYRPQYTAGSNQPPCQSCTTSMTTVFCPGNNLPPTKCPPGTRPVYAETFGLPNPGCVAAPPPPRPSPPPPPQPSPPPPPQPSPPPPTVYTSRKVGMGAQQFTGKVTGGPTQHVLNGGATTSSTETTADGHVLQFATTTTTDATQQGTGNGHVMGRSTSTTSSEVDHPQTYVQHNSPPPTVYTSSHVLHQTTGFGPRVTGGPTQHVLNGGATTTSTETTANGNVMTYVTTTTTDATQQGTGNGHITAQTTDSSAATGHQQTFVHHNTRTTTTDLPVPDPSILPPPPSVCNGQTFAVQSSAKSALCMHVKGNMGPNGFVVSTTVKRPVITMPCTSGSPNQQFTWIPSANGGILVHPPSTLAVSLASTTVSDGAGVSLAANTGALSQEWEWPAAAAGGTIASAANDNFMITDSRVNADVSIGLPVHMWHLSASLPSGAPNAAWYANCD